MKTNRKILFSAGEASGDLHGGNLIRALSVKDAFIQCSGIGGIMMREAGLEPVFCSEDFAVMGIGEVAGKYLFFKRAIRRMKKEIDKKPDLVVLIDFPDFNFKLAEYAKKRGVPVLYYIAPQVWAWRSGRARRMAGITDHLACILDFEKEIFEQAGVSVSFVGHPLLDLPESGLSREEFLSRAGMDAGETLIGLLPGSRKQEIERIFPVMRKACTQLYQADPSLRFAVSCADTVKDEWFGMPVTNTPPFYFVRNMNREIIQHAEAVLVTSGTATLETALAGTPMAVVYKTSSLTYSILSRFVKVSHISLVNIIAGKEIVPEILQDDATPANICRAMENIVNSEEKKAGMIRELEKLKERLGKPGAAGRVADIAIRLMKNEK